ncbi:MAG TPA: FMN-binding negative transcriptional regulator [Acidimicrobiales bacterium]|nr:FMN-binding negative transcriptional regulator [Acidimicrobiales bacterium]
MFIHEWDLGAEDEWRSFVATHGFGELIAAGRNRDVPVVVPTQFVLSGNEVLVHLLRLNPIWTAIAENPNVLLCVSGDWAYVPSNWKAIGEEEPARGIPTTYYASVQMVGTARVIDDPVSIAEVLRTQLLDLQPDVAVVDPVEHGAKLRAIRALSLEVTTVRSKFKYGGNVDAAHRLAVANRLEERGWPSDRSAAAHVRRRLDTNAT